MKRSTFCWMLVVFCLVVFIATQAIRYNLPAVLWAELKIGNPKEHADYAGELVIESVGVNLPCIESVVYNQALNNNAVHKISCAAKMWCPLNGVSFSDELPGTWVIGDHNWQGFSVIMNCQLGDEAVFVSSNGNVLNYVVTDMFEGYVNEYGLLLNREGKEFLQSKPENIVLMTCYPEADVSADRDDRRFFVYLELVQD